MIYILYIMENFLELLKRRRSSRLFTGEPVDKDMVCDLMRAALMSPSGHRINPWEFILVEDKEMLKALSVSKEHGSGLLEGAAMAVAVVADDGAVQHNGAHADEGVVAHVAGMHDGVVADGAVGTHDGFGMNHGTILNIGVFTDGDIAAVTADGGVVPDTDALCQLHVANHISAVTDQNLILFIGFLGSVIHGRFLISQKFPCARRRTMIHCLYTVFWYRCQFAGYGKISQKFRQVANGPSGAAAPNRFSRGISKAHLEQHL